MLILFVHSFWPWMGGAILLGLGTALVYPTLLAAISDVSHPSWQGSAVGVYRLWRDSGYAIGGLLAGILADLLGISWAIGVVGVLTLLSGIIVAFRMRETLPTKHGSLFPMRSSETLSDGEGSHRV
jgi:MFS family permease